MPPPPLARRSRSRPCSRPQSRRRLPGRRAALGWAYALLAGAGCWWALLAGAPGAHGAVGTMFAGGWTLSLLPIHSAPWARRPTGRRRASASEPQPPGSGVEPGGLEDPAELRGEG